MDNFEFFGVNLGKLSNYVQYFGSNNIESVAESWVEAEMSWVELGGAGWSWVELGGGGWNWVEVGAQFNNNQTLSHKISGRERNIAFRRKKDC